MRVNIFPQFFSPHFASLKYTYIYIIWTNVRTWAGLTWLSPAIWLHHNTAVIIVHYFLPKIFHISFECFILVMKSIKWIFPYNSLSSIFLYDIGYALISPTTKETTLCLCWWWATHVFVVRISVIIIIIIIMSRDNVSDRRIDRGRAEREKVVERWFAFYHASPRQRHTMKTSWLFIIADVHLAFPVHKIPKWRWRNKMNMHTIHRRSVLLGIGV